MNSIISKNQLLLVQLRLIFGPSCLVYLRLKQVVFHIPLLDPLKLKHSRYLGFKCVTKYTAALLQTVEHQAQVYTGSLVHLLWSKGAWEGSLAQLSVLQMGKASRRFLFLVSFY